MAFINVAFDGNVEVLKLFLERTDVDVSYLPNEALANAIMASIHSRKQAAVELMLTQDPDLTVADYNGDSAYLMAYWNVTGDYVKEEDKNIFRRVVAAGAKMKPHEESAIKQSIVDQVLGEAGL